MAPLSHFPPDPPNGVRCHSPGCERRIATTRRITGTMERRSPTGIARKRETRTNNAAPHQSHCCERRIADPRRITGTWSAGQFSRWGPPTGIARERETRPNNAAPRQSPGCERRIAIQCLEGKTMQFPKPPPEFSVSSGLPVVRWGACESSAG